MIGYCDSTNQLLNPINLLRLLQPLNLARKHFTNNVFNGWVFKGHVVYLQLGEQTCGGLGGWSYAVAAVRETSAVGLLPLAAEFVVVPLALFGWLSWKSPVALRVSGMLLGYLFALMIFARPENFYWALMIAPVLLGGLGLAPAGLFVLVQRCCGLAGGTAATPSKHPSMGTAT